MTGPARCSRQSRRSHPCTAVQRWRARTALTDNDPVDVRHCPLCPLARLAHLPCTMSRLHRLSCLAALLAVSACSNGESPTVDGESVLVAQRGTSFTEQGRELDREQGVETAPEAASEAAPSEIEPGDVDADTLRVGSVDPSLAARLKADPSAYATKHIEGLVTFRMLSLAGIDLDSLLDYLFSPDTERAKAFVFPEAIRALDQKEAAIVGYMIPLEYKPKTDEIKVFMLVRDLMACCFGGAPRPDEWVYVEMEGDRSSKLYPYLPIVVRGKLTVGRLEDEFGLSSGVYSMSAKSVEEFKAE